MKTINWKDISSSMTRLLTYETCSLKATSDCFSTLGLRNSDETDTVKGTNANDKKSPLLSLIIDEVNHEAYHDFKRNKRFLEIIAATLG